MKVAGRNGVGLQEVTAGILLLNMSEIPPE